MNDLAIALGNRSCLIVPLLKDGKVLGSLTIGREIAGDIQQPGNRAGATFVDQAVIAIQNARLFNETREALDRQTATSEVLPVISGSATDDAAGVRGHRRARGALDRRDRRVGVPRRRRRSHICGAYAVNAAGIGEMRRLLSEAPDGRTRSGRARCAKSAVINIADLLSVSDAEYADQERRPAQAGFRAGLAMPMMREREVVGAIRSPGPSRALYADKEIALLQTFARQAVIAIENARLFDETQGSARAPDRDRQGAQGHQPLADHRPAGARSYRRPRREAVPRGGQPVGLTSGQAAGDDPATAADYGAEGVHRGAGDRAPPRSSGRAVRERPRDRRSRTACRGNGREYPDVRGLQARERVPQRARGADRPGGPARSACSCCGARRGPAFTTGRDQNWSDLRRPGGDRDPEHRLFNETQGALERPTATAEMLPREQALGDRHATGLRSHRRTRRSPAGAALRLSSSATTARWSNLASAHSVSRTGWTRYAWSTRWIRRGGSAAAPSCARHRHQHRDVDTSPMSSY